MPEVDPGTLDPLARQILEWCRGRRLSDIDLARSLGVSKSAISHAFRRPFGFRSAIPRLAALFKVDEEEMRRLIPNEGVWTAGMAPTTVPPLRLRLRPACQVVTLAKEIPGYARRGIHAVIGPPAQRPAVGDHVAFEGEGGLFEVRVYSIDKSGKWIVLMPPGGKVEPEMLPLDGEGADALRVVLMVGTPLRDDEL